MKLCYVVCVLVWIKQNKKLINLIKSSRTQKSCTYYLLKNRSTVKKGAALIKMVSVKKVVKSKAAAKNGCDGIHQKPPAQSANGQRSLYSVLSAI